MSSTADDRPRHLTDNGTSMGVSIGDVAWADLSGGTIERVALLPHGTRNGSPSIEILVRMPDGRLIHANTTWRLWERATRIFGQSPDSGGL